MHGKLPLNGYAKCPVCALELRYRTQIGANSKLGVHISQTHPESLTARQRAKQRQIRNNPENRLRKPVVEKPMFTARNGGRGNFDASKVRDLIALVPRQPADYRDNGQRPESRERGRTLPG